MKAFVTSSSARILFFAFAVAFAGTGVAKLLGPSGLAFGAMAIFTGVAIAIALAMSVEEHFGPAALTVVVLPWLLWLGEMGQGLLSARYGGWGSSLPGSPRPPSRSDRRPRSRRRGVHSLSCVVPD